MSKDSTAWKQKFYDEVETISLKEPLAYVLGSQEKDSLCHFTFHDAIKMAGHACPAVSSAYKVTALALKALYGTETPVRGEILVLIKGGATQLAYGPQSQVITLITGASGITGFKGLGGKYSRFNKLVFDEDDFQFCTYIFQRADTGKAVRVIYDPGKLPEDPAMAELSPKVIKGGATPEEHARFISLWQDKVKKILLESNKLPGLFTVEELKDFEFPAA
ncbi:MAG: FmdE family protein [Deltaproteobacteria bacterium]|nr:FmdE family protein [Deltaproteobacteria bacterium]